jgi:hypothetical protein
VQQSRQKHAQKHDAAACDGVVSFVHASAVHVICRRGRHELVVVGGVDGAAHGALEVLLHPASTRRRRREERKVQHDEVGRVQRHAQQAQRLRARAALQPVGRQEAVELKRAG